MALKNHKMDKLHGILFAVVFASLGVAILGLTSAEKAVNTTGVTGSVEFVSSSDGIEYGDTITLQGETAGRLSPNSMVYITTYCFQDNKIVYQYSKNGIGNLSFTMTDQAGQGLEWDGAAATCSAILIYRIEKGKQAQIQQLDSVTFDVAAAS